MTLHFKRVRAKAHIVFLALSLASTTSPSLADHHEKVSNSMTADTPTTRFHISPDEAALEAFNKLPQDEPLDMLNMIRFKDVADYMPDSGFADKGWSGARAYEEYGTRIRHIADRVGSSVAYGGEPLLTMVGPKNENWDAIFVVRYPNAAAFFGLVGDPEYLEHAFHRTAAVADSRLIRLAVPAPPAQ